MLKGHRYVSLLLIFILISALLSGCAQMAKTDWKSQVVYFVMTDRFYDGDKTNDEDVNPSDPKAYHGGDLQGIIDKLDYIKGLGATAIWITPAVDNEDGGYHGYWAYDFEKVDEHLGDTAKLKELTDKAHSKGMKVILDMVFNHTGYHSPWLNDPAKEGWFHEKKDIVNYNDQDEVENGWLAGLPDINQSNPDVEKYLIDMAMGWIDKTGIDGFRLDTVRHVPKEFWTKLSQTIKQKYPDFFLLGEVWVNDPIYLSSYQDAGIDSITNYPLYYAMNDVFARGGSPDKLGNVMEFEEGAFTDAGILANFLDNHDVPRFMNQAGEDGTEKLKAALAYLTTAKGTPVIYYGTEAAMEGGPDPDNRRDMAWDKEPGLAGYVRRLSDIRRGNSAFTHGDYIPLKGDAVGFVRRDGDKYALVFINNTDKIIDNTLDLPEDSGIGDGVTMRDSLTGAPDIKVEGNRVHVRLEPYQPAIYVP